MATKHRVRLTSRTEIKRTITKIANMVLNGEIDPKTANAIILACNTMLSVFNQEEKNNTVENDNGGASTMKNSRQYKIQSLLRMAEITDDEIKRKQWLDEAEKLVFQDVPREALKKVLFVSE